jgi:hypothetical protein
LTAELEKRGVKTVGDDLYCTQPDLLRKGIEMRASSMILIKVNQVGNVLDAIEVIRLALENNIGIIISHRSGETLFSGIAALFMAFEADALKAGATQPEDFVFETDDVMGERNVFSDKTKQVRRVKYEGTIDIAGNPTGTTIERGVLVVSADYIKASGLKAMSRLAGLANTKLIVSGKDSLRVLELLKAYGGNWEDALSVATANQALDELTRNVREELAKETKITVLLTPEEKKSLSIPADTNVTVIDAEGVVPAEELAIALYSLYKNDIAKKALASLDEKIAKGVIKPETRQNLDKVLADLDSGTVSFTGLELSENVSAKIAAVGQAAQELMSAI